MIFPPKRKIMESIFVFFFCFFFLVITWKAYLLGQNNLVAFNEYECLTKKKNMLTQCFESVLYPKMENEKNKNYMLNFTFFRLHFSSRTHSLQ